jgi:hypothetical protein
MLNWSEADAAHWFGRIGELEALVGRMGVPKLHPFWGSRYQSYLPADRRAVQEVCRTAASAVDDLERNAAALAGILKLTPPDSKETAEGLVEIARLLLSAPPLSGIRVRANEWQERGKDILSALKAG